jgi:basic membrane lipoprotein Med (substrate-binding protein (PBP1-ABC) superfamily)
MSMDKRRIHVLRHGYDWATQREGSARVARSFGSPDEALENARQQAERYGVEVIIHREDGTIEALGDLLP